MSTEFNEATLPEAIRLRLAELRACNNIHSITVKAASADGAVCIVVPTDAVDSGNGWALPEEPFIFLIPHRAH